ncbi:hypothetical protein FACS189452_08650 [Bacteroidia bacterium]|nr:hypothetical protein AGMMS4956_18220 [Bacteroidia bacterium]GHT68639.1 hypothetical protein FACS189452_08650 [Bacteroidia bacterium]
MNIIPDKETGDKLSFITFIIPYFARAYKMNKQSAYRYLKKYGGFDYLSEFWWTLHTENPLWSVRALYEECYRNGGLR